MNRTLFLSKHVRNVALLGLVFFPALLAFGVFAELTHPRHDQRQFWLWFQIGFWIFCIVLGIYLFAAYSRWSLSISRAIVHKRGILIRKQLDLCEVTEAKWRLQPLGGSILLTATTSKLSIDFLNLTFDDRLSLISYFRDNLPQEVQQNWPLFCHQIALPLRKNSKWAESDDTAFVVTRRRLDWYFGPGVAGTTVIAGFLWWRLNQPSLMAAPFLLALIWGYIRFLMPTKGEASRRISDETGYLRFVVIWLFVGPSLIIGTFFALQSLIPNPRVIGIAIFIAWCAVGFWRTIVEDKRKRRCDLKRAPDSVRQWEAESSDDGN